MNKKVVRLSILAISLISYEINSSLAKISMYVYLFISY